MELEERIRKDIELFEKNVKKLRNRRIKEMAERYYEDAKYYLNHNDLPTSFGCINYAHGLIDAVMNKRARVIEFIGSAGSGKTSIIEYLVDKLKIDFEIYAIIANLVGKEDCDRIRKLGIDTLCINTGNKWLDDEIIEDAILERDADYIFIENIGSLVVPFIYPANKRVVVVSSTQGKEIVKKYPLAFQTSDLLIINKIDLMDGKDIEEEAKKIADCEMARVSAKNGENMEWLVEWIKKL